SEQWSMPGTGWANLFLPLFYCVKTKAGIYMQPYQGFTSSYYPGACVVLFAVFAALRVRKPRVLLLAGAGLMSMILALGSHSQLYSWLKQLFPPVGAMRYPVKFIMLASVVWPLLSAYGLREVCDSTNRNRIENWRILRAEWLACVAVIAFLVWFAYRYPAGSEPWLTTANNGLVRIFLLTLLAGLLHMLFHATERRRRSLLRLGFLSVLWLDFLTNCPTQNPTVPRSVYEPGLNAVQNLKPKPGLGESRSMQS